MVRPDVSASRKLTFMAVEPKSNSWEAFVMLAKTDPILLPTRHATRTHPYVPLIPAWHNNLQRKNTEKVTQSSSESIVPMRTSETKREPCCQ